MTRLRGLRGPAPRIRGGIIAAMVRCTAGRKWVMPMKMNAAARTSLSASWMTSTAAILICPFWRGHCLVLNRPPAQLPSLRLDHREDFPRSKGEALGAEQPLAVVQLDHDRAPGILLIDEG